MCTSNNNNNTNNNSNNSSSQRNDSLSHSGTGTPSKRSYSSSEVSSHDRTTNSTPTKPATK